MNLRTAIFDSTDVALVVTWNLGGGSQGNNEKQRVASSLEVCCAHWRQAKVWIIIMGKVTIDLRIIQY